MRAQLPLLVAAAVFAAGCPSDKAPESEAPKTAEAPESAPAPPLEPLEISHRMGEMQAYMSLGDALVLGDAEQASLHAAVLARHFRGKPELMRLVGRFPKALVPQRNQFKKLSKAMITWWEQTPRAQEGTQVVFCPMAQAKWIQPQTSIRNPFYGEEMLECGAVRKKGPAAVAAAAPAKAPESVPAAAPAKDGGP